MDAASIVAENPCVTRMSHGFMRMRPPEARPRFHIVVVEELFSDLLANRAKLPATRPNVFLPPCAARSQACSWDGLR